MIRARVRRVFIKSHVISVHSGVSTPSYLPSVPPVPSRGPPVLYVQQNSPVLIQFLPSVHTSPLPFHKPVTGRARLFPPGGKVDGPRISPLHLRLGRPPTPNVRYTTNSNSVSSKLSFVSTQDLPTQSHGPSVKEETE